MKISINQPIPTINVPLLEGRQIPVNFDVTYQTTFQKKFFGELVDYHKEPVRMEKYAPSDQTAIRETMRLLKDRFSS